MGGVTLTFAACMRAHGLPQFPDPNSQGDVTINDVNPNSSSFTDAQRACQKFAGASGKPSAARQAKLMANALKFSSCMRAHGVTNYPDPKPGPNGIGVSLSTNSADGIRPNSPVFRRAQRACQSPVRTP